MVTGQEARSAVPIMVHGTVALYIGSTLYPWAERMKSSAAVSLARTRKSRRVGVWPPAPYRGRRIRRHPDEDPQGPVPARNAPEGLMILVRTWFRTKWGAASTVVELLKGISATLEPERRARIYTDLSGLLFTVTWETEWPSLAAYEAAFDEMRQSQEYRDLMAEVVDLVETGGRDYLLLRWPET